MRFAATTPYSRIGSILGPCLLALITASPAQPQSPSSSQTTTIMGTIVDATGATIPGAVVSLKTADGPALQITTDSNGHFAIGTEPGEYTFRASAQGFRIYEQSVHLTAATPITQNVTLSVGMFSGPVSVEDPHPVKSVNASLDMLLPLNPLPPLPLSNKTSKHLKR
jgi:hypothetical protein